MKSVLLLRGTPTLKLLPHSCDLFEILCPALGGLVPTDLPRASYNQAIRNRLAAVWTSEHECSLETTCCFVNRESYTRCKDSARRDETPGKLRWKSMIFRGCTLFATIVGDISAKRKDLSATSS